MQKYSDKYKDFLYESIEDRLKDKIVEKYKSLKRGILDLLENTIENKDELVNVQNFINNFIKDNEKNPIIGFVDEPDIFDFYLKYQNNIDEICNDVAYFEQVPKNNNIFSLYEYIIHGTKFAVNECMKILLKELF
jgi:hypothetical protein